MFNIILASKSAVRKKILEENGIKCQVLPSNIDEDFVKENFGPEALIEEIEDALLLKPLRLRGFARSDEYGLSFFAKTCDASVQLDVPDMARQFLAALEG